MTMLQEALIVGTQILMIFIFIAVGIVSVKTGVFTQETGRRLSNFLLSVITPSLIINSYQIDYDSNMVGRIGLSFLLAVIFHIISTIIAILCIRKRPDSRYRIDRIGVMFSNCGYMAIPLIQATLGEEGVTYSAAFIAVFSVLLWSLGAIVLQEGDERPKLRKILITPATVGLATGVLLYFLRIRLPVPLGSAVRHIAATNTPVAMIIIGIFLSSLNIKETFFNKRIYYITFLRLILVPVAVLGFFWLIGASRWIDGADKVMMASMLAASCPAAASTTLFPVKIGMDGEHGARLIAVSTLVSLLTLPAMSFLTNLVIR